jgi:hypothetical protein
MSVVINNEKMKKKDSRRIARSRVSRCHWHVPSLFVPFAMQLIHPPNDSRIS